MPYAHPEVLVTTDWVAQHLSDPAVRVVEVDVDPKLYRAGHIPGAIGLDWTTQLQEPVQRDILGKEAFERLMSESGISPDHTVLLYGDSSNWFAAYAFWLFKVYGHRDVRLINGGRAKWLNEPDKPMTPEIPAYPPTEYKASEVNASLRARVADVLDAVKWNSANLVDVRTPDEFSGKIVSPPGLSESAQRGGHIPGARNIPWSTAVDPKLGTFRSPEELRNIYLSNGYDPDKETIAYCRIGERSSHTWFVLKYLLGLDRVRNYDGSWTEYGSMIGVPIER